MTIESFVNNAEAKIRENSPSILAAAGVGGLLTTTILAHKAGRSYERKVIEATNVLDPNDRVLTGKEKFELAWKQHSPVVVLGVVTATCIIAGTVIGNRRNAALASAVAIGEVAFREYRDKVEEVISKPKVKQIEEGIAQDKVNAAGPSEVVFLGTDEVLCFDTLTARFFKSTKANLERAEIEINRQILSDMHASQNEFYSKIGLAPVKGGDDVGWNNDAPLELKFHAVMEDDKPVMAIDYRFPPKSKFYRVF